MEPDFFRRGRCGVGCGFAAAGLADAQVRSILAGPDAHALDAAGVGVEDFDFEVARTGNHFAAHRKPPDLRDEIAAERIDVLSRLAGVEVLAHDRSDVVEAGAAVGDEGVVVLADDGGAFIGVVLVVDLADHLLDNVLDGHQSVGAAIFVDHQRQMNARRLHLRKQVDRGHRRRHIKQFAHQTGVGQRNSEIDGTQVESGGKRLLALGVHFGIDLRLCGHERDQIADVDDAFGIVERVVVDHEARMTRAFEDAHQFPQRNIAFHRDDVGAGHHHVGDAPVVQSQNIAQHRAFDGAEACLAGRGGVQHHLKVGARRSGLPAEQRAQRAHQPHLGRWPQNFAMLHRYRQPVAGGGRVWRRNIVIGCQAGSHFPQFVTYWS